MLLDAVTEEDMRAVVLKLVAMAKDGDVAAVKLLLDRTVGKPLEVPVIVVHQTPEMTPEDRSKMEAKRSELLTRIAKMR